MPTYLVVLCRNASRTLRLRPRCLLGGEGLVGELVNLELVNLECWSS